MARSAAALSVVSENTAPTLGDLIDRLEQNRKERRPIEAKLKPLEEEASSLKAQIISLLDEAGQLKGGTTKATVSISEIERVVIKDVDIMLKALKREGYQHIIDLKVAAAKEFFQLKGKEIPGTQTEVVRRQLNHTSLK